MTGAAFGGTGKFTLHKLRRRRVQPLRIGAVGAPAGLQSLLMFLVRMVMQMGMRVHKTSVAVPMGMNQVGFQQQFRV